MAPEVADIAIEGLTEVEGWEALWRAHQVEAAGIVGHPAHQRLAGRPIAVSHLPAPWARCLCKPGRGRP